MRIGALDVDCDGHWWWKAGPIPHKQRERGAGGTHVLDCEWTTPPPPSVWAWLPCQPFPCPVVMSCSPRWQMLRCQPTPSVSFPIWGGDYLDALGGRHPILIYTLPGGAFAFFKATSNLKKIKPLQSEHST